MVFGEVIDGARTVKDIELLGSNSGKPSKTVRTARPHLCRRFYNCSCMARKIESLWRHNSIVYIGQGETA